MLRRDSEPIAQRFLTHRYNKTVGNPNDRQVIGAIEQEVLLWHNAQGQAYPMPDQQVQDIQGQLITERQKTEAERQRAERLAAYLRSIGVDPDHLP